MSLLLLLFHHLCAVLLSTMTSTAAHSPSLNDIAFQISGLTYNISNFLAQSNTAALSNAVDAPTRFPADAPTDVQAARLQLLELTLNLHNLILGPEERIRTQTAEVCPFLFLVGVIYIDNQDSL
jgi:hypothetical protein